MHYAALHINRTSVKINLWNGIDRDGGQDGAL